MKIKDILNNIDYKGRLKNIDVLDISYNSKKVVKGALFVAIKGEKVDGHNFIEEAIKNGAIAIVVEEGTKKNYNIIQIEVKNTRSVLAKIATNFYNNPSFKIGTVGVTGTNGKTTITFLINRSLNAKENEDSILLLWYLSSYLITFNLINLNPYIFSVFGKILA